MLHTSTRHIQRYLPFLVSSSSPERGRSCSSAWPLTRRKVHQWYAAYDRWWKQCVKPTELLRRVASVVLRADISG